jgi:hypothetical protein
MSAEKPKMGNKIARFFQGFLNLVGFKSKGKDLRLESPLPKGEAEAREVHLPNPLPEKKEWEATFVNQPTLTPDDLASSNGIPTEIEYIDSNPDELKYVLIALASFEWKMARMNSSLESKGIYKLKFNNPSSDCVFKFIVNDQWMTSENYKLCDDGIGGQNNCL